MQKDEYCDECGKKLPSDAIFDDGECTQFCSQHCQEAWDADDSIRALAGGE